MTTMILYSYLHRNPFVYGLVREHTFFFSVYLFIIIFVGTDNVNSARINNEKLKKKEK